MPDLAKMTKLDIAEGRHLPDDWGRCDVSRYDLGGSDHVGINFNYVTENVFCGSVPVSRADFDLIKAEGFGAILDLCGDNKKEAAMAEERGIAYLHEFVHDTHTPKQDQFKRIVEFIETEQKKHPVYVHCHAGRGRAPTSICSWLISKGHSTEQALEKIEKARGILIINDRQVLGLTTFEKSIR